jgi:phosphoglycolate phosphatase
MILLFDLDGTLTDPVQGFVSCVRFALERLGSAAPPDEVIAGFIGPPLRGTFATLLGGSGDARIEPAVEAYRERYMDVGIYETQRYDGIPEMLGGARALAERVFVATSKPWPSAVRVVRHLGLEHLFDGVYGPELDGRHDDKADLIAHLLEREGGSADQALMIGDRAADVVAAHANGVEPIGVLWGYGSAGELTAAGARCLASTPADLLGELRRIRRGRSG